MNFKFLFFLIIISLNSILLSAQSDKIKVPDSLVLSGRHFSIHGLFGYAQPASIRNVSGPHKLGSSLAMHISYGFSFSFLKPNKNYYTRIGLDVNEWFENYKYKLTKSPTNGLFFDMLLFEHFYILESYYLFIERGKRFSLKKNFFVSPFIGTGVERVRLLIGEENGYQTDSLMNSRHILQLKENNLESSRMRFRVHSGIEISKLLPWQHIVSIRFIASYSPGKFVKGNYIFLPGTAEESTGTYDLKGNYFGLELAYTFTGIRKKRLEF